MKRWQKKMKCFKVIINMIHTGLIRTSVITRAVSIVANGCQPSSWNVIKWNWSIFFIAAVVIQKSLLAIEQEEHGAIKLLAQRKLESIAHIISHAIQQGTISFIELHRALQEIE